MQPTVQPTTNPGTGGIQNDGKKWEGNIVILPKEGVANENTKIDSLSSTEKTIINLDSGRHVLTLPSSAANAQQGGILIYNNGTANGAPYKDLMVSSDKYKYVQIGSIADNNNAYSLFYRFVSNQPVELPTAGKATYKGDAILNFRNLDNSNYLRTELGKVEIGTDFTDKTLNFSVNSPSHKASIPGVIGQPFGDLYIREKDNKYLGADTYSGLAGGFTGPNAEEIMGTYTYGNLNTNENINGVFAGKKE